jgi:hypothetical protein
VLDHDALRPARRPGRVDDVSQVRGRGDRLDGIRTGYGRSDAVNTEFIGYFREFGSGQEDAGTAVFDDRAHADRGILRVDRHVCGARAQDSVDRDDQLRRARHHHRDALVALNTPVAQHLRNVIRGGVELRIAERPAR